MANGATETKAARDSGGSIFSFAALALIFCLVALAGFAVPPAHAQGATGGSIIELDFRTEDGQPVDGVVVQSDDGVVTATAGEVLEVGTADSGPTTVDVQPAAGTAVLQVACAGAERSRTIISGTGAQLTITPNAPVVTCMVTMLTGLPVTGLETNALAVAGLTLVAGGAITAATARRFD